MDNWDEFLGAHHRQAVEWSDRERGHRGQIAWQHEQLQQLQRDYAKLQRRFALALGALVFIVFAWAASSQSSASASSSTTHVSDARSRRP
jgi:hypothetical protein